MMTGKYGSNRVGWNQRGPTNKQMFEWAKEESEQLDPESYYWQNKAQNAIYSLGDSIGYDACRAFGEAVYPGETIDGFTWQHIHNTYTAELARVQAEQEPGQ